MVNLLTVNRTGKRYGRLLVLEKNGSTKDKHLRWLCKCDCGNEITVNSSELRSGDTKSCGCIRKEITSLLGKNGSLEKGMASMHTLYMRYMRAAKKRNLVFDISSTFFHYITSQDCVYCGAPPNQIVRRDNHHNGNYIYNGIDRFDNSLGYIESNCVPCCKICNVMKFTLNIDEFYNHIQQILKFSYVSQTI